MPEEGDGAFSNPVAPSGMQYDDEEDTDLGVLTNDDFRKLLMTPRQVPGVAPPSKGRIHVPKEYNENEDAALRRQKKKKYYAKLKKEEEEREKELAQRYRDRARERRDGVNPDYQQVESSAAGSTKTAEYRAVAPNADAVNTAAERRRLEIQESKFLGGDMEHTHLVKGLDFALLQKVRSEITNIDSENPEQEPTKSKKDTVKDEVEFKSAAGRKIFKAMFDSRPPRRNELFAPGRMAYIFELDDDEFAESDIPTTSIRSKADCPVMETQATLTTNDIVINKLTQILSYLRQGVRSRKMKKRDAFKGRHKDESRLVAEDSIYADFEIGKAKTHKASKSEKGSSKYFDKAANADDEERRHSAQSVRDLIRDVNDKFGKKQGLSAWDEVRADQQNRSKGHTDSKQKSTKAQPDSYAECYPGAIEMADAANDSDDEPDYTQMDMGNKKGPVKRWDFETEEDYNTYMESREAMPKAAFQFGIKMAEGRKTRTRGGHLDEKQKLDREWQKISKIISKRKGGEGGGDSGKRRKDY